MSFRPGGYLALDTPKTRVNSTCFCTRPSSSTPITSLTSTRIRRGGRSSRSWPAFKIVEAKAELRGVSCGGGGFLVEEVATRRGVFAQIEDCYLLAYLCKKPD